MADSTNSLSPVLPPTAPPAVHSGAGGQPPATPLPEPGQVIAAQVVRLLSGVSPGPYQVEVSLLDHLTSLVAPEPYPPGTELRLRAVRIGAETQLRIIEATLPSTDDRPVRAPSDSAALERVLASAMRARGTNQSEVDLRPAADMLRSMGIRVGDSRAELSARVVADLVAHNAPVTPATIRGGESLYAGVLERPVASLGTALQSVVDRFLEPGPERDAASRMVVKVAGLVSGTVDRVALSLPARVAQAIDQLIRMFSAHDPELAALRGALGSLRSSVAGLPSPSSLQGRVELLLEGSSPSQQTLASDALRDLSPTARWRAIETFVHIEREHLESKPWFVEFRGVAREVMERAESLAYLQWLDLGSLDDKPPLFLGSGVFSHPDRQTPFRMTVTDDRDEDGDGLGFRISIDSKTLGRVEVRGRLDTDAEQTSERGDLALEFVVDDPITGQQVDDGLVDLTEALDRAGYHSTATAQTRRRPSAARQTITDATRLDLQA